MVYMIFIEMYFIEKYPVANIEDEGLELIYTIYSVNIISKRIFLSWLIGIRLSMTLKSCLASETRTNIKQIHHPSFVRNLEVTFSPWICRIFKLFKYSE